MRIQITATGFYAPPRVQTAAELAPRVGRSEEWIIERTGVRERRISEGESMEVMAAKAARLALGDGPPPDLIVNASLTPLQLIPDSSVFIQEELGFDGIPSFSVHATCLSWVVALHAVAAMVQAGAYQRVLLVSSEQSSASRNLDEPESAVLLGDGAAATIIEPTPEGQASALLAWKQTTWPEGAALAELRGCGTRMHPNHPDTQPADNLFHMEGPAIYKRAVKRVLQLMPPLFQQAGITPADIDLVVPHQASGPAMAVIPRLGFPKERIVDIVGEYGNCVAASTPMALAWANERGMLHRGDHVLVLGTGAGLSTAGAVLRW